ncbi:MAG: copper resistance CopC family protein [Leifsonia flava]
MSSGLRRRLGLVGAGVAVLAASVLGVAGPASAHNYPVSSTPAEGSTVTEQPGTVSLTTNDNLLSFGNGSAIEVSGPASDPRFYGDGCSRIVDATIETDAQLGQPGTYTVTWQVVSTDGHPVSGEYQFEWAPADGTELAEGSATAPTCATAEAEAPAAESEDGSDDSTTDAAATSASSLGDLLWIAGALAVVVLAVVVTLLVLRRRNPDAPSDADAYEATAPKEDPGAR